MSQDNTGKHQDWKLPPNQQTAATNSLGVDFDAWLGRQKESRKDGRKGANLGQRRKIDNIGAENDEMDVKMPPAQLSRLKLGFVDNTTQSEISTGPEKGLSETTMPNSLLVGQNPGDNFGDLTAAIEKSNFALFARNTFDEQNYLQHSLLLQQQQQQLNHQRQLTTNLALLDCLRQRERIVDEAIGSAQLSRFENALLPSSNSLEALFYPAQQLSASSQRTSLAHLALLEQLSLSSQEHQQFATAAAAAAGLDASLTRMDFAELSARHRCNSPFTQMQQMTAFPSLAAFGGRAFASTTLPDGSSVTPMNANEHLLAINQVNAQEMTIRTAAPQASKKRKNKKDKHKPKRPLSAYNFFFQEERSKLLNEIANSTANTTEDSRAIGAPSLLPGGTAAVKRKRRRDREEPHGMIAFENLAKIIGSRWKNVTGDKLKAYQQQAETDLQRYKQEMEAYHHKKRKRARIKDQNERSETAESNTEDSTQDLPRSTTAENDNS